jgi:hypothetical protein
MASYPVIWRERGRDAATTGRLELGDGVGFSLHGGPRGEEVRAEILYDDLERVCRDHDSRIGSCQALQIDTRTGRSLLLATIGGIALLNEIYYTLALNLV